MAFAWISDKTQKRAIFIAIQTVIIIIGLTLTGYSKIGNVRYFGKSRFFSFTHTHILKCAQASSWEMLGRPVAFPQSLHL